MMWETIKVQPAVCKDTDKQPFQVSVRCQDIGWGIASFRQSLFPIMKIKQKLRRLEWNESFQALASQGLSLFYFLCLARIKRAFHLPWIHFIPCVSLKCVQSFHFTVLCARVCCWYQIHLLFWVTDLWKNPIRTWLMSPPWAPLIAKWLFIFIVWIKKETTSQGRVSIKKH